MKTITRSIRINPLFSKAVFSSQEAKALGVQPSLICYYVKNGLLERLGRGIYKATNTKSQIDFKWEDLVLTTKSIHQGVICLISALSIYELTDEMPRAHWIAVPNKTTAPKRPNTIIKRMRDMDTGLSTWHIGGNIIPIFDRERTIIDAFRFLSIETAIKALKVALKQKNIDLRKLDAYSCSLRVNIRPYLIAITI